MPLSTVTRVRSGPLKQAIGIALGMSQQYRKLWIIVKTGQNGYYICREDPHGQIPPHTATTRICVEIPDKGGWESIAEVYVSAFPLEQQENNPWRNHQLN